MPYNTLNHYDALGYAEGWNLVANPRESTNLMEVKASIENELKHARRCEPYATNVLRRTLRAKLAGFNNALATLLRGELALDISIAVPDDELPILPPVPNVHMDGGGV